MSINEYNIKYTARDQKRLESLPSTYKVGLNPEPENCITPLQSFRTLKFRPEGSFSGVNVNDHNDNCAARSGVNC